MINNLQNVCETHSYRYEQNAFNYTHIYNLQLKGEFDFQFETACDIEIILHLYEKFGIEVRLWLKTLFNYLTFQDVPHPIVKSKMQCKQFIPSSNFAFDNGMSNILKCQVIKNAFSYSDCMSSSKVGKKFPTLRSEVQYRYDCFKF